MKELNEVLKLLRAYLKNIEQTYFKSARSIEFLSLLSLSYETIADVRSASLFRPVAILPSLKQVFRRSQKKPRSKNTFNHSNKSLIFG